MNRTDDQTLDDELLATVGPLESYDPERTNLMQTVVPGDVVDGTLDETPADLASRLQNTPVGGVTLGEEEQTKITEICSKFESAWEEDREPSIEDFLPDQIDSGLRISLVRELVLLDIECRKKKNKSVEPSIYLSKFSDCRGAVESALSQRRSTVPRGYGSVSVPTGSSRREEKLQHADDESTRYRPKGFHARGGLGEVFRADDEELNRLVALKEILPEHADNQRVQEKFVFEAEVTGSLEHPGIVPVYGLGRYEDNQPYYAMRFIRGQSFRDKIEEFHKKHPTPTAGMYYTREFRMLMRRFIESCNAIHYAHEHGVLHRDIKPDNIMLGDYGETLVVDWGLAKRIQAIPENKDSHVAEASGSQRLNASRGRTNASRGSAVGTPMYMSPEQADGLHDQLDGRTDIYSLGAMLFNIVSSGHPIEGKSTLDVVRNVREGKTKSLRSVAPSAPRAIASICAKAMKHEPSERYCTAVELADDVDRWMNDELVHAHIGNETIVERTGRLIRRHKSWTISGAAALLVITLSTMIAFFVVNHAREQERVAKQRAIESRENERIAKVEAQASKLDAVERYRDSRDAIDTWLVQSSEALEFFPGTQSVRRRLLQLATEDFQRLSARDSRDPELELERGRVLVKLGDLNQMQQDFDEARSHYDAAQELFKSGGDSEDLGISFLSEHGNVHTRLGTSFAAQERNAEAKASFEAAVDELTKLANDADAQLPRRLLAVAHVNSGELLSRIGNFDDAIGHLENALTLFGGLSSATDTKLELGVARTRELLGRLYTRKGQYEQGEVYFNDAVQGLLPLVAAQPDHPDFLDALASVYVSQASNYRQRGLGEPVLESLRSAVQHYGALEQAMPDVPAYTERLAIAVTDLGLAYHENGLNVQADAELTDAHERLVNLVNLYGQVPRFYETLAACRDARGQVLLDLREDPQEASVLLGASATTYQQLVGLGESPPEYFERLAIAQSHYAQALVRQTKTDAAEQYFTEAIATLVQLISLQGDVPRYSNALAHVHYRYALMLHDAGDQRAVAEFEAARDLWMALEVNAASFSHQLAWILATCPAESIRDPAAALAYAQKAVDRASENPRYLTTQALATLLSGDTQSAIAILDQAKTLRRGRADRDWFVLAMAQHQSGQLGQAQQSLESGSISMQENQPFNADLLRLLKVTQMRLGKQAD